MDKPLASRRRIHFSRRTMLLASLAVIVAALAGLVGYHQYAWGQYDQRAEAMYADARSKAEQRLESENASATSVAQLADGMNDTASSLCALPFLGELRLKIIESARQQQEACEENVAKLHYAAKAADALRTRLGTEQELVDMYRSAQVRLGEAEGYRSEQQIWRDTKTQLEALDVGGAYQEQKDAQIAVIDGIITGYDALGEADKNEKRLEFDAAVEKLQESYDALSATSEATKASYRQLVEDLAQAIAAL